MADSLPITPHPFVFLYKTHCIYIPTKTVHSKEKNNNIYVMRPWYFDDDLMKLTYFWLFVSFESSVFRWLSTLFLQISDTET